MRRFGFVVLCALFFCGGWLHAGLGKVASSDEVRRAATESAKTHAFRWELAACAIVRDEGPYIDEWIAFHQLVGVEHFFLYDNLSEDHTREVLKPYIEAGLVTLIAWPYESNTLKEWEAIQLRAYKNALRRTIGKARWLAVFDVDEFLVPVQNASVVSLLSRYNDNPDVGGVFCYCVVFGTSWIDKVPDDALMIETLTLNGGARQDIYKSIVRPERVETMRVHRAEYLPGYQPVPIPLSELQMNHYWSRDEHFLETVKIPRRVRWGTSAETSRHWATNQNNYTPYSETILRFVNPLRELLGLD